MSFVVKAIDLVAKTVLVDWGWTITNHPLPQAIVENPDMTPTLMRAEIETLRPELPPELAMTPALAEVIEMRVGTGEWIETINYENYDVQNQTGTKEF